MKTKKRPSPANLLAEVRGIKPAKTYEFDDYLEVVDELKQKEFSYADIAKFLAEKLGIAVTRGQVYRAHDLWLDMKREQEAAEAEERWNREQYEEQQREMEPPPEVDEVDLIANRVTAELIQHIRVKYPENSIPISHAELLKRALSWEDSKARDEFSAERADRELEERKRNAADRK